MLTIVTPAADKSLITLDSLKSELDISDSSEDTLLTHLIAAASRRVVNYTGREFIKEEVKETLGSRSNSYRLVLERTPILEITELLLDGEEVDADKWAIEDPDLGFLRALKTPWVNTEHVALDIRFVQSPYNRLRYEITYSGGYVLGAAGTDIEVPADIKQATIELAKSWFVMRGRDSTVTWERIGDAEERRADPNRFSLPPAARYILDDWVRLDSMYL